MASKEVKTSLKSAREAIRNKDFKEALKHCKAVLKLDKNNYNALVFIGLCASEMEQPEQAKMAYKKAIDADPSQLLAWQGLSNLCEKIDSAEAKAELVDVYGKLVYLYESSDKVKWKDTIGKLSDLYKGLGEHNKAVDTLKKLLGSEEEKDGDFNIWCQIIDILEKEVLQDSEEQMQLHEAYRSLVHAEWPDVKSSQIELYHGHYINFLLKIEVSEDDELRQDIHESITEEAKLMTQTYPHAVLPLEVQGKTFLEESAVAKHLCPEGTDIFQRLCDLAPASGIGTIGLGYTHMCQKDYIMASDLLKKGLQAVTNLPVGWLYLSHVQVCLHDYSSAEKSAKKGLDYIAHFYGRNRRHILQTHLRLKRAEAVVKQGSCQEGVEIYQQLLGTTRYVLETLTGLGSAHLALSDIPQATEFCKKALDIDKCYTDALALQGQISFQEGLFDDAELRLLEAIDQKKDCAYYYFLLGKLYWEMNGNLRADKSKCAAQFLKAAKLDPYHSPTFLYLGHYYQKVAKATSKACRCFQKAFDLDPHSKAAGIALGDVLIETGQEEAALNLCTSVTSASAPGRAKWAWLRLGLVRLRNDESSEAISCFQSALRADPSDKHCWECLGEAYLSRGSYTAALKAFTKASQLDSSSIYCLFQMAAIKQKLCVYSEAIKEYVLILEKQPDYVPALKGLGEAHLSLARSCLRQDLNGRTVDHVTEGLRALAMAIESRPGLSCLWKLIGDCCSAVCPVAHCCVSVALPENLKKIIPGEHMDAFGKRDLLALATSAYGRALKVQPHCASLWNDLGYSYFLQLKVADDNERERIAQRAVQALKKGLGMQPSNHKLWNTLGVITASSEVNNPELSQHSLIMSIKTEPNNVVAWTNLGVLYLKHHKIELAHEAFKNAQALEPSYTAAWIGQASIAEIIGNQEAMDLFRHTTELGSHVEGSIGYAHWVCTCLIPDTSGVHHVTVGGQPVPSLSHLPVEYRRAVVQSSVALSKYTDRIRDNAGAFNMFGLLMEHQKLYIQAEMAYASAIKLLQESSMGPELLNAVYINQARVLCSQGRYHDAIPRYQSVKPLVSFHDVCGLALALFMSGQLADSYQAYEQALQLAGSDANKSCVLAAMGMIDYALNDKAGAKAMLLESSQLTPPCARALMALCALGLVNSDVTLAGAALSELMKLKEQGNKELAAEVCYFFSRFYALQGNQKIGRSHISKAIHRYPNSDLLWSHLAAYIIQACPDDLQGAACCAEAATTVNNVSSMAHLISSLHPAGLLGSGAFSCRHADMPSVVTATHRTRAALVASQKAVHAHPEHVSNWALLSAAVTAQGIAQNLNNVTRHPVALGTRLSQFVTAKALDERAGLQVRSESQLSALLVAQNALLEAVQTWSLLHTGYSLLYSGLVREASIHTEEALSLCNSSPQVTTALHLLKAQISLHGGDPVEVGMNTLQATVLSSVYQSAQAWQVLGQVQANLQGSPMAAELCYRQCLQAAGTHKSKAGRLVPLIRLAFLALSVAQNETKEKERWVSLCHEAASEVLKLSPGCTAALVIQGVAHFLQDNCRSAKRILLQVAETNCSAASLARYWLMLFYIKKNDQPAIKLLLSDAMRCGDSRVDLMYYQLSRDSSASAVTKRRFLQKCVHHNPAMPLLYWRPLSSAADVQS